MQQAEAHTQLGEMMQQLAFICCFASFPPSAAEELPRALLPAAALIAEMPQAQKQGLRELVHLIDSHLTKRVVGPTAQPGNPTAEEPSITRPASSHDLPSTLAAWKARQLAKGPTGPFKAYHLPAADKQASVSSQAQAGGASATDPVEATRNLLKETLLSGQQEAPWHGDNSSNRVKSTRERLREKLNAIAAAGEGVQAAEPSAQPVSTPAGQGSTPLAQLAASAMAAAPSQALGLESGPGAAHVPDMSDAPEAKPAKKMGKNQRRKAAAEASKAQQPTAAAGNADGAAVQPEAATSSSSEGTASGPGSPAQVSPRPVEGDSKAATSSQESRPAQPSSTSQAEAASAHSSAQNIAEACQGQAARSDFAPVSSEAVAGRQQPESADASSKAAAREVDSDNSAQASTKAAVSISKADAVQAGSKADAVQAGSKADAVQAGSKAAGGNREADTTNASSRAAAEVAEPISAQTGSTSLAGTGTAATAHASNIADTSMPEAAAAQADSKADAGKTEPAAAQVGNTAAATQAGNGSAAAVAQPSSGDRAVDGANREGTANKNTVLSQSDKAADKDTPAQLAQKADQPPSSAAAVPPAGIAAHRPRVPKAVLRATAAPYTPLNPSAAVSKAKGIAMGELATPFASACHSCTYQHTFLSSCLCCCCSAMPCLPVHGLAVFVCLVMSSIITAAIL